MRIPGTKVWRAFPELDRFDDDQCARFRRGAKRSRPWAIRVLLGMLIALVGLLTAAAVAMGCFWLVVWLHLDMLGQYDWRGDVRDILLVIVVGGAGLIAGLLLRDRLLRKRITWVIAHRGSCLQCRYVLLGLPVDAQLNVICPECGTPTPVDPALGELSTDERGIGRFTPKQESVVKPWLTPAQWRRLGKWTAGIAIAVLIVGGSWWGWGELQIRRQAEMARAERNLGPALMALVVESSPNRALVNPSNAFDVMMQASLRLGDLERAALQSPDILAMKPVAYAPEYGLVGRAIPEPNSDYNPAAEREVAVRVLKVLPGSGVIEALDSMARCSYAEDVGDLVNAQNPAQSYSTRLAPARQLARMNWARLREAWRTRQPAEFASALSASLALGRICRQQPTLIHALTATAIDAGTFAVLREIIAQRPPPAWLDVIDAALSAQALPAGYPQRALRGERELILDEVRSFFADIARVRQDQFMGVAQQSEDGRNMRVGSYSENTDAIEQWFEAKMAFSHLRPFERNREVPKKAAPSDLAIHEFFVGWDVRYDEMDEIERLGVRVMIALERYRLAHDQYPERLEELVPDQLANVPIDPWSGRPLCYLRSDPTHDALKLEYRLYSIGADGEDNGGRAMDGMQGLQQALLPGRAPGFDFVINQPIR